MRKGPLGIGDRKPRTIPTKDLPHQVFFFFCGLRGPVAILFISRDTCSDSIATVLCLFLWGIANYRAICCKMGYRTDVPVKLITKGGYRTILGSY